MTLISGAQHCDYSFIRLNGTDFLWGDWCRRVPIGWCFEEAGCVEALSLPRVSFAQAVGFPPRETCH